MLCISDVLKCILLILKIIFQWGKKNKYIIVSVCINIILLTQWQTILLVLCKMYLKGKSPRKQD